MPIKKTVYVAHDGTNHNSLDAAIIYENLLDLYDFVDKNPIYNGSKNPVKGQEFGLWLKDHPRIFVKLLPVDVPEQHHAINPPPAPQCPNCGSEKWRNRDGCEMNKNSLRRVCDHCGHKYEITEEELPFHGN